MSSDADFDARVLDDELRRYIRRSLDSDPRVRSDVQLAIAAVVALSGVRANIALATEIGIDAVPVGYEMRHDVSMGVLGDGHSITVRGKAIYLGDGTFTAPDVEIRDQAELPASWYGIDDE